jgi:hypothetical protein
MKPIYLLQSNWLACSSNGGVALNAWCGLWNSYPNFTTMKTPAPIYFASVMGGNYVCMYVCMYTKYVCMYVSVVLVYKVQPGYMVLVSILMLKNLPVEYHL